MKNNKVTDVFFDLDHTLWDFDRNSALTFAKIFDLNSIDVNIADFLSFYEPINLHYWKLYREERIDKQSLRFCRLNDAFLELGMKVDKDVIFKLSDDYITYLTTHNFLFEDTHDVLSYLKIKYNLHIITNGFEEVQNRKLTQSNINHFFKTITNSEMVGVKKPNPKIFNYALEKAKATVETSIMIGDSYEADILGAQNVGMDVILVSANKDNKNGIKQVTNLIELKQYL
ncbi:YjjG family noncanonical pyrimidine nucleotidase [Seonamhaeicola aphaedonensis]|uniref:Putative hydrolase of the HAD superfamily n=1 Tax=Seonamhaeicola aphaedonensis TaxID=1461338 RepID=A0A3D9HMB7_9FLAO|nr:YjjG family noncanonical pyrimidine nucleotidase [Seonamhaeicola aphaedonensis]RED50046.1 putative hydrolase of the HAD superfamily [Seonamhaeicola aphaedonensis]